MAKKKENLKEMSVADLNKNVSALREELRTIRFKAQGTKAKNVKHILSNAFSLNLNIF